MPAPRKRYIKEPGTLPPAVLYNGHLVIPLPSLQGLLKALISRWDIPQAEQHRLERELLPVVCSLSDVRFVKRCEDDPTPNKEASVLGFARYINGAIEELTNCPAVWLQTQAQALDILLQEAFFPKIKRNRNTSHVFFLLREQLPAIHKRMIRDSACKERASHRHPSQLPDDETLRMWSGAIAHKPYKLRNAILAYYHGMDSDYLGHVLAGRKQ